MVTRKPVGPPVSTSNAAPGAASKGNPPYPTSPVLDSAKSTASSSSVYSPDLNTSPAFDLVDINEAKQRARSDSGSSHGTWDSDDTMGDDHETEEAEIPKPLNIRPSQQDMKGKAKMTDGEQNKGFLPASLRIGGEQGPRPMKSSEGQRYEEEAQANPWAGDGSNRSSASGQMVSNNPYHQPQNGFVGDSSQSAWQEVKPPPIPSAAPPLPPSAAPPPPPNVRPAEPVELSAVKSPTGASSQWLSGMSLQEDRPASWETAEVIPVPQKGQAPLAPVTSQNQQSSQRPASTWWQDAPASNGSQQQSGTPNQAPPYPIPEDPSEPEYAPPPGPPPSQQDKLINHDDAPSRPPKPAPITTSYSSTAASSSAVPETPGTQLKRQRNENYQIKHINWYDTSDPRAKSTLRQSPILTQNANGPCPLLALVNALVLSTPQHLDTALVEVLRTREQISLGLLLDAVFDELMSGRRGETAQELPDVSELYSFLLALHTGMNVNPRFVTPISTPRGSLDGRPTSLTNVHPMHRAQRRAGVFEETREMRLYSTFNIPLIHGWTAPADSPAYEAFIRSAPTFEDAQNIQFSEAELEDKQRSEGLTPQEQQILEDIQTIKAFLDTWPTQLTDFGLQTIAESLNPGQFAILFRNDHFSTLYKEPTHGALMTLVTDAGYSTHAEIVWESLVDVTGAASEMFSGDFRSVSHNQDVRLNQSNSGGGQEGWQTVPSRNSYKSSGGPPTPNAAAEAPPPLPGPRPTKAAEATRPQEDGPLEIPDSEAQRKASEQEDHDLALALQLQEEEEAQQRETEQRRRREQELSEQFLSSESEGPRPPIPPRRNGGRGGAGPTTAATSGAPTARPAVSRPTDDPSDPDAPPSYEQAASDRPYRPAGSTAPANLEQGNPLGAYDALRRQQSAYAQNAGAANSPTSPVYGAQNRRRPDARYGRRQSQMGGPPVPGSYVQSGPNGQRISQAATVKDADDRCVIM